LEMQLRRALKSKLARGHVELTLAIERADSQTLAVNRELVGGYISAFRKVAGEFGLTAEPDLNGIFKMPGALDGAGGDFDEETAQAVLATLDDAVKRLETMRAEEGKGIDRQLREHMQRLLEATHEIGKHRAAVSRAYLEKVQLRMQELIGAHADRDRILQEAALLAERSDIREELVRLETHVQHFIGLLDQGGEVGKKLDFLLQEMGREANTLMSKTSGLAGEALRITEVGLGMKAEIEKSREQVQNVE
ncbi:MAG: YicC/YloC family endoribonuclease, partial [Terriglobales bacterium]